MWIMISGPYRSGTKDPIVWKENLTQLNRFANEVFKLGHIPVIGVNAALPMIEQAGEDQYSFIMMPLSMALAERCDAVLRVGGASKGADDEVELFVKKGLPVYTDLSQIPRVS